MKRNLRVMEGKVNHLSREVTTLKNQTTIQLATVQSVLNQSVTSTTELKELGSKLFSIESVQARVKADLKTVKAQLKSHKTSVAEHLDTLLNNQNTMDFKLDSLDLKQDRLGLNQDTLNLKQDRLRIIVTAAKSELEANVLKNITRELQKSAVKYVATTESQLATVNNSIKKQGKEVEKQVEKQLKKHKIFVADEFEVVVNNQNTIADLPKNSTKELERSAENHVTTIAFQLISVNASIRNKLRMMERLIAKNNTILMEHCQMQEVRSDYECGGTGGWRRVVYLNMTDTNINCPSSWQLTSHSKRTCGKFNTNRFSCDSVFFPVSRGNYTSVCGSIRAYQYSGTDAFQSYNEGRVTTINEAYVAGVSLTHGSPRQHIWTFAAGYAEDVPTRRDACPCDASISIAIPPFVGGDYFCESGVNSGSSTTFYPDDPLWDGEGCSSNSSCCSFNNPPYFTKQLPSPTSDPIEARLCQMDVHDDSPVEFMELYVK